VIKLTGLKLTLHYGTCLKMFSSEVEFG